MGLARNPEERQLTLRRKDHRYVPACPPLSPPSPTSRIATCPLVHAVLSVALVVARVSGGAVALAWRGRDVLPLLALKVPGFEPLVALERVVFFADGRALRRGGKRRGVSERYEAEGRRKRRDEREGRCIRTSP